MLAVRRLVVVVDQIPALLLAAMIFSVGACSSNPDSGDLASLKASSMAVGFQAESLVEEELSSLKSELDESETYALSQEDLDLLAGDEIVTESDELQALSEFVKK